MTGDTISLHDPAATHRQRFSWISRGAIVVSFAHMAGTMALYSGGAWYDRAIAGAMTLIVDLALWSLAEYLLFCRQQGRRPHGIVPAMFGLAVVISIALNAAYLWSHRPAEQLVPEWLSVLISGAFSLLVSGFIVAAAVVDGELSHEGAVQATLHAAIGRLQIELDQARAQLAESEGTRLRLLPVFEQAEQQAERWRLEAEQHARTAKHWRTVAERDRTGVEQERARTEHWRTEAEQHLLAAEQSRAEAERWRAEAERRPDAEALDPNSIIIDIAGRSYSVRQVAEAFGTAASTASTRLASVREKGAQS